MPDVLFALLGLPSGTIADRLRAACEGAVGAATHRGDWHRGKTDDGLRRLERCSTSGCIRRSWNWGAAVESGSEIVGSASAPEGTAPRPRRGGCPACKASGARCRVYCTLANAAAVPSSRAADRLGRSRALVCRYPARVRQAITTCSSRRLSAPCWSALAQAVNQTLESASVYLINRNVDGPTCSNAS